MSKLFDDLLKANTTDGRIRGIGLGVVSKTDDPENLERVQVWDMSKGGQSESDWLYRLLPYTQYTPPLPRIGDLVVVAYVDGDPHKGVYLGVVHNDNNPPVGTKTDLSLVLGKATVRLTADGKLTATGIETAEIECKGAVKVTTEGDLTIKARKVVIDSTDVSFANTSSLTVAGKDIATVDAIDTRNDRLVTKGW